MENRPQESIPSRVLHALESVETSVLVLSLAGMIVLAVLQIVLRNAVQSGLIWIDPLLRRLVLWIALLGAMVASRNQDHLSIDVINHFLPPRAAALCKGLAYLFTALVCAALAHSSGLFLLDEYEYGMEAMQGVPSWIFQLIMPLAFAVMALRYLAAGAILLRNLARGVVTGGRVC
ncbi:MAG: TRAP transporter small permease [Desulfovibrio sp.]